MLGVLRLQNGGAPEFEPQPGVRDLPTLIERTRQAGLETTLTVEGAARELPAAVDLSVYRIVQEALTNVIRHAHAEQATVTLGYAPDALEVTVLDDGTGPNGDQRPRRARAGRYARARRPVRRRAGDRAAHLRQRLPRPRPHPNPLNLHDRAR